MKVGLRGGNTDASNAVTVLLTVAGVIRLQVNLSRVTLYF